MFLVLKRSRSLKSCAMPGQAHQQPSGAVEWQLRRRPPCSPFCLLNVLLRIYLHLNGLRYNKNWFLATPLIFQWRWLYLESSPKIVPKTTSSRNQLLKMPLFLGTAESRPISRNRFVKTVGTRDLSKNWCSIVKFITFSNKAWWRQLYINVVYLEEMYNFVFDDFSFEII